MFKYSKLFMLLPICLVDVYHTFQQIWLNIIVINKKIYRVIQDFGKLTKID